MSRDDDVALRPEGVRLGPEEGPWGRTRGEGPVEEGPWGRAGGGGPDHRLRPRCSAIRRTAGRSSAAVNTKGTPSTSK
jgi:hypothetical protein